ncbi:helix-turn-helix domain-containing protein [Flavobacterium sp.]|uniref:helix-turn-helix domain-containing protein n=1 Tax=Flavobacterium sp. TaxID=239 RepID=UPI002FD87F4A
MEYNDIAHQVLQFVNQTQRSLFLTGKAGTGKTTLLHQIIKTTHKNTIVVAPTGIAALNAGGVTLHSMFQLPFGAFIPDTIPAIHISTFQKIETQSTLSKHFRMNGVKKAIFLNMELLIIDEVSMLRADILDAVDFMLRKVRKNEKPFGGVQVLFIGDLLQLPPVVKNEEWQVLKKYYPGIFFFNAKVIRENPLLYVELTKIYRQSDQRFISVLNSLRNNTITRSELHFLNEYVKPNFDTQSHPGYITLTTHNAKADAINAEALHNLNAPTFTFKPEIVGDFPEKIYPVDELLSLKIGAQVMFIKNDPSPEKNYYNGKMGFVKFLSDTEITVHFPDENRTIEVDKYEWKNIKYSLNEHTKEIDEETLGTFVHFPLKLAWAITVHKSQGLTFEKAVLDVSQVFLPGQAYVALSRLRNLDGLVLLKPIQMNGLANDSNVMQYAQNKADNALLTQELQKETEKYSRFFIQNAFEWSDLIQHWRNHKFSYTADQQKSEKAKHYKWATNQEEILQSLAVDSVKFQNQLNQLFHKKPVDFLFVKERVVAAKTYFFPKLDKVLFELLLKMEEVKRKKRAKEFYSELAELEERTATAVLNLFKAEKWAQLLAEGKEVNKDSLSSLEALDYRNKQKVQVQEHFKANSKGFTTEEVDSFYDYTSPKKKVKEPKKSTIQETLVLWKELKSIREIAQIRMLTEQTITNHLVKLIRAKEVEITEILSSDKIQYLQNLYLNYPDESLTNLKEMAGDRLTWEDLKLYKAALETQD